jgi:osmotically-inducible protein OsmY
MKDNKNLLNDVKQALAGNTAFRNCLSKIDVLAKDGAVIIAGVVESTQLKQLAKKIIDSVPGVSLLIDDLKIEATPQHRVSVQIDWVDGTMALSK